MKYILVTNIEREKKQPTLHVVILIRVDRHLGEYEEADL